MAERRDVPLEALKGITRLAARQNWLAERRNVPQKAAGVRSRLSAKIGLGSLARLEREN